MLAHPVRALPDRDEEERLDVGESRRQRLGIVIAGDCPHIGIGQAGVLGAVFDDQPLRDAQTCQPPGHPLAYLTTASVFPISPLNPAAPPYE
jgi:hypothetical protein